MSACTARDGRSATQQSSSACKRIISSWGKKTVELAARVAANAACGIGFDMAMHLGMVHDLTQQVECLVGVAGGRCAVAVEPAAHGLSFDPGKRHVSEHRQKLALQ